MPYTPTPTATPIGVNACVNNLAVNGGFEGSLSGWSALVGNIGSSNDARSGANALLLNTGTNGAWQFRNATAGQRYQLSAYSKKTNAAGSAQINLSFFDSNWLGLATNTRTVAGTGSYEALSIDTIAPANTAFVAIWSMNGGTGEQLVDDICLRAVPTVAQNKLTEAETDDIMASNVITATGRYGEAMRLSVSRLNDKLSLVAWQVQPDDRIASYRLRVGEDDSFDNSGVIAIYEAKHDGTPILHGDVSPSEKDGQRYWLSVYYANEDEPVHIGPVALAKPSDPAPSPVQKSLVYLPFLRKR